MSQKMTVELVTGLPAVCDPRESDIPIFPAQVRLSTAYVPFQAIACVLEPCDALMAGTVFPELASPAPTWGKRETRKISEANVTAVMPGENTPNAANVRAVMPGENTPNAANVRAVMPGEAIPNAANIQGVMPGKNIPNAANIKGVMPGEIIPNAADVIASLSM